MFKLSLDKLNEFFAEISGKQTVYIPTKSTDGQTRFEKWIDGSEMSDALKTVRSAKDFFFPQIENIVDFKMENKKIEVIDTRSETEDFVIFGVRACDARSFSILDKVFLSDPVDSFYKNRREHGTIVSIACTRPTETCFCHTFGIDAASPEGDVCAWKTETDIYFEARTEKGEKFISMAKELMTESDDKAVNEQKAATAEIMKKLPLYNVKPGAFSGDNMLKKFNSEKWASLSQACLGCGTCTFVCPTCQCYDIKDFNTGHGVKRFRCWDSCMYSDFTKMAGGQPRLTQLERFRQRFMHKLVYFPMNNEGEYGCVGCGRCLEKCPIQMNIVKVMKTLEDK